MNSSHDLDFDFEYHTSFKGNHYQAQVQRYVRQFSKELNQVIQDQSKSHACKLPKLYLLEVMCSSESELTKQVQQLGGKAKVDLAEFKEMYKQWKEENVCSMCWFPEDPNISGTAPNVSLGVNGATSISIVLWNVMKRFSNSDKRACGKLL